MHNVNSVFVVNCSFFNMDERDHVVCVFTDAEKAKEFCDKKNTDNFVSFFNFQEFLVQ
jgi:hypothetical protein